MYTRNLYDPINQCHPNTFNKSYLKVILINKKNERKLGEIKGVDWTLKSNWRTWQNYFRNKKIFWSTQVKIDENLLKNFEKKSRNQLK